MEIIYIKNSSKSLINIYDLFFVVGILKFRHHKLAIHFQMINSLDWFYRDRDQHQDQDRPPFGLCLLKNIQREKNILLSSHKTRTTTNLYKSICTLEKVLGLLENNIFFFLVFNQYNMVSYQSLLVKVVNNSWQVHHQRKNTCEQYLW